LDKTDSHIILEVALSVNFLKGIWGEVGLLGLTALIRRANHDFCFRLVAECLSFAKKAKFWGHKT